MTATERLIQEQVDTLVRDLAQMRERAVQAEAELAEMTIERDAAQRALYDLEQSAEAQNVMRAQGMIDAAIARAERAEAALAAVPWQALLNIYECLTLPAVALDGDVDALAAFLNQYAPWAPNESAG